MKQIIKKILISIAAFVACLIPGTAEETKSYQWTYYIYGVPVEVSFSFEVYNTETDVVYASETVTGKDGAVETGNFEVPESVDPANIAIRTVSVSDGRLSEYDISFDTKEKGKYFNVYAEWYPEKLTVDIPVEKKWVNMSEPYPDVEIQLLQDNEPYGDPVTLSNGSGWTYTFEDLDRFKDDGYTEHEYSVTELTKSNKFTASVDGYTITNTGIPEEPKEPEKPKTYSITVNKQFVDDGNGRPEEIKINILDSSDTVLKTVVLTEENEWSAEVKDLSTDQVHLEEVECERNDGVPYFSVVEGTTITNTPVFSLDVVKKVPSDTVLNTDINLTLFKVVDGRNEKIQDIVLNKGNDYHVTLENLYACDTYVVYEKDCNGTLYSGIGDTISHMSDSGWSLPFTGNAKTVNLTLFNVDDTQLSVYKTWVDSDGKETEAPVSDISFKLYNNGRDTGIVLNMDKASGWKKTITLPSNTVKDLKALESSGYGSYITPLKDFETMLVKNNYTVKEQNIEGWTSTVTKAGNTITVENKKVETKKPETPAPKKPVPNTSVSTN